MDIMEDRSIYLGRLLDNISGIETVGSKKKLAEAAALIDILQFVYSPVWKHPELKNDNVKIISSANLNSYIEKLLEKVHRDFFLLWLITSEYFADNEHAVLGAFVASVMDRLGRQDDELETAAASALFTLLINRDGAEPGSDGTVIFADKKRLAAAVQSVLKDIAALTETSSQTEIIKFFSGLGFKSDRRNFSAAGPFWSGYDAFKLKITDKIKKYNEIKQRTVFDYSLKL